MEDKNKAVTTGNSNREQKIINSIIDVLKSNNLTFSEARSILYKTGLELDNLSLYYHL